MVSDYKIFMFFFLRVQSVLMVQRESRYVSYVVILHQLYKSQITVLSWSTLSAKNLSCIFILGTCRCWRNTRRDRRTGEWLTTETPAFACFHADSNICLLTDQRETKRWNSVKLLRYLKKDLVLWGEKCVWKYNFLSMQQNFPTQHHSWEKLCMQLSVDEQLLTYLVFLTGWARRRRRKRIGTFTKTKHHNHITSHFDSEKVLLYVSVTSQAVLISLALKKEHPDVMICLIPTVV